MSLRGVYYNREDINPWKFGPMKELHFSKHGVGYNVRPAVFMWDNLREGRLRYRSDHVVRTVFMYTYKRTDTENPQTLWRYDLGIDHITIDVYEMPLRPTEFYMVIQTGSSRDYAAESRGRQKVLDTKLLGVILDSMNAASRVSTFRNSPSYAKPTTEPGVTIVNMVLRARDSDVRKELMIQQSNYYKYNAIVFEIVKRAGFIITDQARRNYVWRRVYIDAKVLEGKDRSMSDDNWELIKRMRTVLYHAELLQNEILKTPISEADLTQHEAFCAVLGLVGESFTEPADGSDDTDTSTEDDVYSPPSDDETYWRESISTLGISDGEEEEERDPYEEVKLARRKELLLPTPEDYVLPEHVHVEEESSVIELIRAASHGSTELFVRSRSMAEIVHEPVPLDMNKYYLSIYAREINTNPLYARLLDRTIRLARSGDDLRRKQIVVEPMTPVRVSTNRYIGSLFALMEILDRTDHERVVTALARWMDGHDLTVNNFTVALIQDLMTFLILILVLRSKVRDDDSILPFDGFLHRRDMPQYKNGRRILPTSLDHKDRRKLVKPTIHYR